MATFTPGFLASYMSKALRQISGRCWLETNTRRLVSATAAEAVRFRAAPASSSFMVLFRVIVSSMDSDGSQSLPSSFLAGPSGERPLRCRIEQMDPGRIDIDGQGLAGMWPQLWCHARRQSGCP